MQALSLHTGLELLRTPRHDVDMTCEPTPSEDSAEAGAPSPPVVHQFTVLRGMAPVIVIETCDWYLGLLQAALARVRLEGHN